MSLRSLVFQRVQNNYLLKVHTITTNKYGTMQIHNKSKSLESRSSPWSMIAEKQNLFVDTNFLGSSFIVDK